tara:strand:+ start:2851 stop:3012 length:162 start_codon:yes stop_codon:yes gene_type:complete
VEKRNYKRKRKKNAEKFGKLADKSSSWSVAMAYWRVLSILLQYNGLAEYIHKR